MHECPNTKLDGQAETVAHTNTGDRQAVDEKDHAAT